MLFEHHATPNSLIYSADGAPSVPIFVTFGIENRVSAARPILKTRIRSEWILSFAFALAVLAHAASPLRAQVNATVNTTSTIAVMPEYFMGAHASVYDNSLQYTGSPVFNQLDGLLDAAGVNVLRYPGSGYADVFHFSASRSNGGITGFGLSPWWGGPTNYGYMGPKTDFGNFVKLLDGTNSKTVITVNIRSAIKYTAAGSSQMAVPTHNGQPQEAAVWSLTPTATRVCTEHPLFRFSFLLETRSKERTS
jgi:hypothetical protein